MADQVWEVVEQLREDEVLQAEFLADPREWLSERGISSEMVERLLPMLTAVVVAGGVIVQQIGPQSPPMGWR